jgi:hypothetical protein
MDPSGYEYRILPFLWPLEKHGVKNVVNYFKKIFNFLLLNFFASSIVRIRIRIRNWTRTQMHNSEFIYQHIGDQLIRDLPNL